MEDVSLSFLNLFCLCPWIYSLTFFTSSRVAVPAGFEGYISTVVSVDFMEPEGDGTTTSS